MKNLVLTAIFVFVYASLFAQLNIVQTDAGKISGQQGGNGVRAFKGVPFAAPPVGELRWKRPQPLQPWEGVKECKNFAASPMQNEPVPFVMYTSEFLIPKSPISEDCLYLNIWTSAKSSKEKRPVLVWIYGGGFTSGGTACPIYDGEAMAAKGIIFVSVGYRVGVFGFLAHPELRNEEGASGNYGLHDQIAALKWIQKNISAFGGDPGNVTIAGQSAGSMSVNCLVASPLAKGLFNKAIAQSGAFMLSSARMDAAELNKAEENGKKFLQQSGALSINALRAMKSEDLLKLAKASQWGPIIDGRVLPASVPEIFRKGEQNDVVLMTGWNQDEGFVFAPVKKPEEFKAQINTQYGANAAVVVENYPAETEEQVARAQLDLSRDQIFGVQNYAWALQQAEKGKKVYVYRFTRKLPATGELAKYGAFHTGEVPYVFDNLKFLHRPWERIDHELATTMSSYWVNFIKTGNPNGKGLTAWPVFDQTKKLVMVLGEKKLVTEMPDLKKLETLYSISKTK